MSNSASNAPQLAGTHGNNGGNKPREGKTGIIQHVVLAGFSNAAGQTVGHPFDLLKIRLQIQGRGKNLAYDQRKYKNVWHGLGVIYREEGALGWFSAWRISAAREWWYSGLRVGLYEPCKELCGATDPKNTPLGLKILSGLMSGTVASTLSNPLDLLKVRYQAAMGEEYRALPSPLVAIRDLAKKEGIKGLWRGFIPNTGRAAGITAVQLSSYDHIKHHLLKHELMAEGKPLHFFTSVVASLLCILFTNPIDVVKTRMMNFANEKSVRSCCGNIFRSEGFRSFYKGSTTAWLRLGPHTVVTFMTFEWMRKQLDIRPI